MDSLKLYIYNEIFLILKYISIDYNIDYNNLTTKYMETYEDIYVEKYNNEYNNEYYIDELNIQYNKNGFILNNKI